MKKAGTLPKQPGGKTTGPSAKNQIPSPTGHWNRFAVPGLILFVVAVLYFPFIGNGFVWDDAKYILGNEMVKDFSPQAVVKMFTQIHSHNYAPVTDLVNSIVYLAGDGKPAAFHTFSLLIHLLNTFLVYRLLRLLSKNPGVAGIGALLFGIHPIQVETVAWASGSSNLYGAAFFLASFICFLKFRQEERRSFFYLSLVFFVLSLLSKAVYVMLPFALLLADYLSGRRIGKSALLEKAPFLLIALGIGVMTLVLRDRGGVMDNLSQFSFFQRVVFAFYGFTAYLLNLVFPLKQSAFYPYPIVGGESIPALYYVPLLVVAVIIGAVAFSLKYGRKVAFGLGFFTVMIFILLQWIPVGGVIRADRYAYIPSVGIFFLAGTGAVWLWEKRRKALSVGLTAAFTLFFLVQSYSAARVWSDERALWDHVLGQYDNVPYGYYNRGNVFLAEKDYRRAIADYDKAIANLNEYVSAYYNRGIAYMELQDYDRAGKDFTIVLGLDSNHFNAYQNRGNVYLAQKDYEKAAADYSRVIEILPDYPDTWYNRGIVWFRQEQYECSFKAHSICTIFQQDPNGNRIPVCCRIGRPGPYCQYL